MLVRFIRKFSDLKLRLYPHEYFITQGKGPERPFTGAYWWYKEVGNYHCIVCDQSLFPSHYKFHPTTGLCAFFASHKNSTNVVNGELECSKCKSHLGLVQDNGPPPTYKHLQVKSGALRFEHMPWFTLPPTRKEHKTLVKKNQRKAEKLKHAKA